MNSQNQNQENNKKISVSTIIGIAFCVILIPILISNLILIIKGYANPNEIPGYGKTKPLIVLTESMHPTIKAGDLIFIKEVPFDEVEEGDIITFFADAKQRTTTVTHRVDDIIYNDAGEKIYFITKGDNNNVIDADRVTKSMFIGVYKSRLPLIGDIAIFLQTPAGLIVAIIIPLGLLVGYDMVRRKLYEKKNDDDTNELLKELELLRAEKAKAQQKNDEESSN